MHPVVALYVKIWNFTSDLLVIGTRVKVRAVVIDRWTKIRGMIRLNNSFYILAVQGCIGIMFSGNPGYISYNTSEFKIKVIISVFQIFRSIYYIWYFTPLPNFKFLFSPRFKIRDCSSHTIHISNILWMQIWNSSIKWKRSYFFLN